MPTVRRVTSAWGDASLRGAIKTPFLESKAQQYCRSESQRMNPDASYDESLKRTTPAHQTGDKMFTCLHCYAPVVDSEAYKRGHKERLGHWPEERKGA